MSRDQYRANERLSLSGDLKDASAADSAKAAPIRIGERRRRAGSLPNITLAADVFCASELDSLTRGLQLDLLVVPVSREAFEQLESGWHQPGQVFPDALPVGKHMLLHRMFKVFSHSGVDLNLASDNQSVSEELLFSAELVAFYQHIIKKRDVFVAADSRRFIGRLGLQRRALEAEFETRILSRDEFMSYCQRRRSILASESYASAV